MCPGWGEETTVRVFMNHEPLTMNQPISPVRCLRTYITPLSFILPPMPFELLPYRNLTKPRKPYLKFLALCAVCPAIVMNLVVSKLPPFSCRQHNTSYGCQNFQIEKPRFAKIPTRGSSKSNIKRVWLLPSRVRIDNYQRIVTLVWTMLR